jgi:nicotinate-nucleotide pyrophosphorylase
MNQTRASLPPLYPLLYQETVRRALVEDLGRAGDLTTDAIVSAGDHAAATIVARAGGCIARSDLMCSPSKTRMSLHHISESISLYCLNKKR